MWGVWKLWIKSHTETVNDSGKPRFSAADTLNILALFSNSEYDQISPTSFNINFFLLLGGLDSLLEKWKRMVSTKVHVYGFKNIWCNWEGDCAD